jgi:hypothetical protein
MSARAGAVARVKSRAGVILAVLLAAAAQAQTNPNERAFPQPKAAVEKAVKSMQSSLAGHLPSLEGFATPAEHPLDRYQRGYYQSTVQVTSLVSGGSLVLVTTKVTAWYTDPVASRSGYQLLTSNGRLESDLLDQLAEQLAKAPAEKASTEAVRKPQPVLAPRASTTPSADTEPAISAPAPKFPDTPTFSSSVSQGLAERATAKPSEPQTDSSTRALQAEASSLEEILKNQAHPKNLVAVKKSGTPVVGSPSLTAKPLFLASLHDEFEMLDFNSDWVHVRISGLSRGWIWRTSVEMPDGIPDTAAATTAPLAPAADLFHITREETALFPGDWEPLRGKSVKIISVQKVDDTAKDAGPRQRLEYAKFLLDKSYTDMSQKPQDLAGIVLIFDSADGGMVAATLATLQQWRAGKLSDSAFWHNCFFDPPEALDAPASAAPASPL